MLLALCGCLQDEWGSMAPPFSPVSPELAKLRQFPISPADTGTKGAPIEREDIFNSAVSQRIKSISNLHSLFHRYKPYKDMERCICDKGEVVSVDVC